MSWREEAAGVIVRYWAEQSDQLDPDDALAYDEARNLVGALEAAGLAPVGEERQRECDCPTRHPWALDNWFHNGGPGRWFYRRRFYTGWQEVLR